jgi:hypothetical protein
MTAFRTTLTYIVLLSAATQAAANQMACGDGFISDEDINPLLMVNVLEKCGKPTEVRGNTWYYEKQGKILIFNDAQQLVSIQNAKED